MCPRSAAVRRRGRVVELVDDDDVEVARIEVGEPGGAEALDRREHVIEAARTLTADPALAEGWVAQRVAEGREALFEDLLAVGHEQQAGSRQRGPQARVVDGRHHRLAGARRRDEQVAVVTLLPSHGHLLEQPLLKRLEAQLDRAQQQRLARTGRPLAFISELRWIIGYEVAAVPVAFEHRGDLDR
jgi:hypothetical protein